ncbi:MAG: gliding motility-associated protein GldE [Bacteroidota bacterium]
MQTLAFHPNLAFHPVLLLIKSFEPVYLLGFLGVIFLLLLSAMFSGSETAYFSLSPTQKLEIHKKKKSSARIAEELLDKPKHLLATLLISNNFINIAIVLLSTWLSNKIFDFSSIEWLGIIFKIIVITGMILLLGEILPKVYASYNPLRIVLLAALPLKLLNRLCSPLSFVLIRSTRLIENRMDHLKKDMDISELSEAIDITSKHLPANDDKRILKGIVKFGAHDVKEIMKPRVYVTALGDQLSFKEVLDLVIDSGYSRIPVYSDTFDNIRGLFYIKDLLPYLDENDGFVWQNLIRPAFFVPENKKLNDLLIDFQKKKIHLAIVVDEYGGASGIVTLEDIMEEIVGEINDEFDTDNELPFYLKTDENNYIFEGRTSLNDFCKITGSNISLFDTVKGESETLAGLILEFEGNIPEKNKHIRFQHFDFSVISSDKRRIKRIKVHIFTPNKDENQ